MQSAVETLSPTRVRLTVEVPFGELEDDLKRAYREIGQQVRVQGFRPGKVPARILDQRVGRGAVLQEAIGSAIPRLYSEAVRQADIAPVGQPDVDVTQIDDGKELTFTAEVDVRPEITLPAYDGLSVTVDPVTVTDEEVDEQLTGLRDRFSTLTGVERPVETGDFVSIDLAATIGGRPVEGGETTGMSYEVGSGSAVDGLDEALVGMTAGESRTFPTELVAGEHAGETADVAVTVRSVKVKELPALDDAFAAMASEFTTLEELRADVRDRLGKVKALQQGMEARDKVLEALLEVVEVPLPEAVVEAEIGFRRQAMEQQLEQAGLTLDDYLQSEGRTAEELEQEVRDGAVQAVKAQFVLDAVADKEEIGVTDGELSDQVVRRAQRAGVDPNAYAQQVVQSGQLNELVAEVRRGKALATVLEAATVTDTTGAAVDLTALRPDPVDPPDVERDADGRRFHVHADGAVHYLDEPSSEHGDGPDVQRDADGRRFHVHPDGVVHYLDELPSDLDVVEVPAPGDAAVSTALPPTDAPGGQPVDPPRG